MALGFTHVALKMKCQHDLTIMCTHFAIGSCQNQDLLDFRISRIELAVARMATILKIL